MADVVIKGIGKTFGEGSVLDSVDLHVKDGEFLALVGASGCGKSTLLRIIAGLEGQSAGSIAIGGQVVNHLRPCQRRIAMVFQSYALYPHMTVRENIATPLLMDHTVLAERLPILRLLSPRRRSIAAQVEGIVAAVCDTLGISHLLDRRPAELSGGQRQRVALGRAMVRQPAAFLMDEPLSNLDAKLRVHMRKELAALHKRLGATFIYVTHDQVEAMTMADRIALMEEGQLLAVGTPQQLYHEPANLSVARFVGSPRINVFAGQVVDETAYLEGQPVGWVGGQNRKVLIGVRPENLSFADHSGDGLEVQVIGTEDLGHEVIVHASHSAIVDDPNELRIRLSAADFERHRGRVLQGSLLCIALVQPSIFEIDGTRTPLAASPLSKGGALQSMAVVSP